MSFLVWPESIIVSWGSYSRFSKIERLNYYFDRIIGTCVVKRTFNGVTTWNFWRMPTTQSWSKIWKTNNVTMKKIRYFCKRVVLPTMYYYLFPDQMWFVRWITDVCQWVFEIPCEVLISMNILSSESLGMISVSSYFYRFKT